MTVSEFCELTLANEDSFELEICSFGDNRILFKKYVTSNYPYRKNKYADKNVCCLRFGDDWARLILSIGEDK